MDMTRKLFMGICVHFEAAAGKRRQADRIASQFAATLQFQQMKTPTLVATPRGRFVNFYHECECACGELEHDCRYRWDKISKKSRATRGPNVPARDACPFRLIGACRFRHDPPALAIETPEEQLLQH